jgi:tetratricopeptide (TPR) repeat protein
MIPGIAPGPDLCVRHTYPEVARSLMVQGWTRMAVLGICIGLVCVWAPVLLRAEDVAEGVAEDEPAAELETEPLPVVEPTPVPRPKRLAAPAAPLEAFGQPVKRRSYGGKPVARTQPGARVDRELATEPLRPGEGGEEVTEPAPTPVRRRTTSVPAKQYSYLPGSAAPAPGAAGRVEPDLLDAEPLSGRELRTEPLSGGEASERTAGAAGTFGFQAEVDRNTVHLDESFTLTIEITAGDLQSLSAVRFTRPEAFDLINSSRTESRGTVAGVMVKTRTQHYVFLPLRTGGFTLPAAEVTYQGRVFRTRPVEITVEGPRSGFAYQRQFSGQKQQAPKLIPAAPDTDAAGREAAANFFANLDAKSVYVNQQVTLTIKLRYQTELGLKMTYTPPPLTGFLTELLQQTQTEAIVSGGRDRWLERTYRTALFPIQPGSLTVGAAEVAFSKWGQNREQSTEPLALEVKPLPPDPQGQAGASAGGLVGRFQLTAALAPGPAQVDGPLRLQVTVAGEGNVRAAPEPVLELDPSVRVQAEGQRESVTDANGVVQGSRTQAYLLVPRKPGKLRLGRAWLRYFDPQAKNWQTAQADLPVLQIEPKPVQEAVPAAGPAVPGRPLPTLRPIHGGQETLRQLGRRVVEEPRFWILPGLGLLALLAALGVRRWQRQWQADPQALRTRRALAAARQSLHEALGYQRRGEVSKFYDCLARVTTEYLAAKFSVPAATIVSERLNEYFDRFQVPNLFRSRFKITLTACEYVRFAAVELPSLDMRSLHRDLSSVIEDFERYWRKAQGGRKAGGAGAAVAGVLCVLGLFTAARAGEPELYFLRGNAAYEQGQFDAALTEYQRVIALGITDPDVYYNLGNTYVKLGQVGRAVLAYEKGLRLAPRDTDLRFNLAQAAAWAVDAQPEEARTRLGGLAAKVYGLATANELAWAAAAAFAALLWSVAGWMLWPVQARRWRAAVWTFGWLWIAAGAWSTARTLEPHWRQRAVVLVPAVDILGRPYRDAEKIFALHEGTRVTVGREEEEWVEVRFGQGRHGWVRRGGLGMIE